MNTTTITEADVVGFLASEAEKLAQQNPGTLCSISADVGIHHDGSQEIKWRAYIGGIGFFPKTDGLASLADVMAGALGGGAPRRIEKLREEIAEREAELARLTATVENSAAELDVSEDACK